MPLISITTSQKIQDKAKLLKNSSKFLSDLTNKPESFVMVKLSDSIPMLFAGNNEPCCFVDIRSIGSLEPSKMSKSIGEFISKEIGVNKNRIYINFDDIDASMWAWNNKTFG